MTSSKIFVGIDVSESKLDVYARPLKIFKTFSNSMEGIKELILFLFELKPTLILLESTGNLEQQATQEMLKVHLPVSVINPSRARKFAQAADKAKTDKIDAQMLADFAHAFEPDVISLKDEATIKIKALSTRRRQLLKIQTAEKNRLKRTYDKLAVDCINKMLSFIKGQIFEIDAEVSKLIEVNESWKQKSEILISVPGVGKVTSNQLISSLPELGAMSKKKVSKLVGVAPINNDSGKHKGKRTIKGGRFPVRAALYMAVLSAIKHNPKIKAFYQHLIAKGKLPKVAITACMHKLIHILNTMIYKMEPWKNT
jgi:transposase